MEKNAIIQSIAKRGNGEIYLGVVGAVRTGKSTFIKRFIENIVVPNIKDEYEKKRCLDEIPQSAQGKTIMTTEPKFVPSNGANIQIYNGNNTNAQKFKLIKYNDKKQYTGMDVSSHQGKIDWNKVANARLGFAIIRAGYGGNWTSQDDKEFKNNVRACAKYNIPYGIYLYSYAREIDNKNKTGVKYEADHVLRLLNEIKKTTIF